MSTVEPRFGNTILTATSDPFPIVGTNSLYAAVSALSSGAALDGQGTAFPTTPAPVQGQWFLRTDQGIQYRYDGTQWRTIGLSPFLKQASLSNVAVIGSTTTAPPVSTGSTMTPPVSGRLFWTISYFCRFTAAGSMSVSVDPVLNAVVGVPTAGNGNTQTVNAANTTTGYTDVVGGTTYTINLRGATGTGTGIVAIDNATVAFQYGTLMP